MVRSIASSIYHELEVNSSFSAKILMAVVSASNLFANILPSPDAHSFLASDSIKAAPKLLGFESIAGG